MSESSGLTAYAELADVLEALPLLVREARRARELSIRSAGEQIGMDASTLWRIEQGASANTVTVAKVLRWLGAP